MSERERIDQAAAELIRKLREHAGLTQEQLSRRMGKRKQFIQIVEKGGRPLRLCDFVEVAQALGANPEKELVHLLA